MSRPSLALAVVSAVLLQAGVSAAQEVRVGARAGLNLARLGGDAPSDRSRNSAMAGVYGSISIGRMIVLGPEGTYIVKGGIDQIEQFDFELEVMMRHLEVVMPVALALPSARASNRIRLYVGPTLALKMDCTNTVRGSGLQAVVECGIPFTTTEDGSSLFFPDLGTFDVGVAVGAGFDMQVGPGIVSADIRHIQGLTDLNDIQLPVEKVRITTRALQLLIGIGVIVQRR